MTKGAFLTCHCPEWEGTQTSLPFTERSYCWQERTSCVYKYGRATDGWPTALTVLNCLFVNVNSHCLHRLSLLCSASWPPSQHDIFYPTELVHFWFLLCQHGLSATVTSQMSVAMWHWWGSCQNCPWNTYCHLPQVYRVGHKSISLVFLSFSLKFSLRYTNKRSKSLLNTWCIHPRTSNSLSLYT